jgi:hypothetical protein
MILTYLRRVSVILGPGSSRRLFFVRLQNYLVYVNYSLHLREKMSRIYVGNLPMDVRERELDDLFYKYGRIKDIEIK